MTTGRVVVGGGRTYGRILPKLSCKDHADWERQRARAIAEIRALRDKLDELGLVAISNAGSG